MSSSSTVDHQSNVCSQPRGFLTPPPTWKTNRRSPPVMPRSEMKPKSSGDLFHIVHKIPSGDSPYVRAKHVQLVDKDPSRAISLFWQAINAGDRVDSALKDMAVVMKQLNRSDEAIEAIKSFRHLSPPESQESLDNILVELYKQSGRMEEEIELLQYKLKQVEEGMAFCGRKTKIARSQGKKVQITVQKEYSRLLGNLAWAYMQHKDFKSAEEHYRKALSFEPDKNKQCNLAVCLMHMNKLTEARFLLEAISCGDGAVDESYAKSYERASEILAEFESQRVLQPVKQMEQSANLSKMKPFGGQWGSRFCSQKHSNDSNGTLSSPLPSSAKMSRGASTDIAYEKRADFDWRANHYEANANREGVHGFSKRASEFSSLYGDIPKVPLTQPRRCLRYGDQRKGSVAENANGNHCRKLSFGSSARSETLRSYAGQNVDYYSHVAPSEMPNKLPQFLERRNTSPKPQKEATEEMMNSLANDCEKSAFSADSGVVEEILDKNPARSCKLVGEVSNGPLKKSWADMVEEDEEEEFNDENVDFNRIPETPKLHDLAEKLSLERGSIDLAGGYLTQPEKNTLSKNQTLRRSLCYDQDQNPDTPNHRCASPLTTKELDFVECQGGGLCDADDLSSSYSKNRRRLQVFQDITRVHGSSRP